MTKPVPVQGRLGPMYVITDVLDSRMGLSFRSQKATKYPLSGRRRVRRHVYLEQDLPCSSRPLARAEFG